jgi:hypothetical protein
MQKVRARQTYDVLICLSHQLLLVILRLVILKLTYTALVMRGLLVLEQEFEEREVRNRNVGVHFFVTRLLFLEEERVQAFDLLVENVILLYCVCLVKFDSVDTCLEGKVIRELLYLSI